MKLRYIFIFYLLVSSCDTSKVEQTFISSYSVKNNEEMMSPNYSFINLRNDSILFRDLYLPQSEIYIGQIPGNNSEFFIDGILFKFKKKTIEVSDKSTTSVYRILKKKNNIIDLDNEFLVGKTFAVKTSFSNDTITFKSKGMYKNITENTTNRWSLKEIDGVKILWLNLTFDEVPLILESVDQKKIITQLYALKKETVILEQLPLK